MRRSAIMVLSLSLFPLGCVAPKDHYVKSETGPHGVVTVKRVAYSPEEQAARVEAERFANSRQTDPQMVEIEKHWPKLTEAQRTSILRTVQQMVGETPQ